MRGAGFAMSFNKSSDAALEIFSILNAADMTIEILSCHLGQTNLEGDAAAEMLGVNLSRFTGTQGATGSTDPTARAMMTGFPSNIGTAIEAGVTNTSATQTLLEEQSFNLQAGWDYAPIPEERWWLSPSEGFVIAIPAPTGSVDWVGTFRWMEYGG
jgi:hypothetical protein